MTKTRQSPSQRQMRPKRLSSRMWVAVAVVGLVSSVGFYAYQGTRSTDRVDHLEPIRDDPGVVHIHGLGINPADGDLYVATHGGVFRVTSDGRATRIANRYQDTMGFTVVGPDHFLASGHPDLREDLPPLLGLLESRDAGRTWIKKSLLGEADFHALRYAHGTIYGYDSTGSAFMTSRDGRTWQTRSRTTVRDFVVGPSDPDLILATTPDGLARSEDGGRTWSRHPSPPQPVLLDWEAPDRLWLVDSSGRIHLSTDAARNWEARGQVAEGPEAFVATDNKLYLAVEASIFISADGGSNWELFYQEDADR